MLEKSGGKGKEADMSGPSGVGDKEKLDSDVEWSDAEFCSECDSDKNVADGVPNTVRHSHFNPETDMENPQFLLGMVFPSSEDFKKAVREYAILANRSIVFKKNENRRVKAVCKASCPWLVFASSIGDNKEDKSLMIKTYNNEHTRTRVFDKK